MGSSYSLLTITHFKQAWNLLFHQSHAKSFEHDSPKKGEEVGIRRFKCKPELVQEVECAVCLCRIEEGEEIRELRCDHIFHRVCLDRWLGYGHATCPLCRGSSDPRRMAANLGEEDESHVLLFSPFCSSNIACERSKWWLRSNTSSQDNQIRHLVCLIENAIINLLKGQEQTTWLIDLLDDR
ncbi:hypothetical protein HHK36_007033 [Tetracentron sinense]|uniref:RING-type domain-containing protein n=1 Tax=Tetracentron sinense TaxID=13715 RepID=A0A834ZLS2_TETSI|nr:hypothetical protein HHK36_007033 [Tetracentron sinense]